MAAQDRASKRDSWRSKSYKRKTETLGMLKCFFLESFSPSQLLPGKQETQVILLHAAAKHSLMSTVQVPSPHTKEKKGTLWCSILDLFLMH